MNLNEMAKIVYHALDEKKAEDIKIIDISEVSVIADYFIIASGSRQNHVKALIDNVEDELAKHDILVKKREGYNSASWVLLDYEDIIVHVFDKENRLFYDLERIWRDGKEINPDEL